MANKNTNRIAIELATGDMYVVQQIDFRTNTVHCWGQVVAYKGLSMKHSAPVQFPCGAMRVLNDVTRDQTLVRTLFAQAQRIADATQGPRQQLPRMLDTPEGQELLASLRKAGVL